MRTADLYYSLRHPGESRGPVFKLKRSLANSVLDSGFHRNDEYNHLTAPLTSSSPA